MQVTKQLESGENPTLTNVQYLQQLRDEMSSYSKKQDKVRNDGKLETVLFKNVTLHKELCKNCLFCLCCGS